jgi:hypothetical protein
MNSMGALIYLHAHMKVSCYLSESDVVICLYAFSKASKGLEECG